LFYKTDPQDAYDSSVSTGSGSKTCHEIDDGVTPAFNETLFHNGTLVK
jgi:hypothetical protein